MKTAETLLESRKRAQPWLGIVLIVLLVAGWFYPPLGYFMVFCMLMAMGIGVVQGRYWCDWMCPRGSFWDYYLSRFSRKVKVPAFFRHIAFRLFWIGLLMTVLVLKLVPLWGNWYMMGKPFVLILTVTTGVGIVLGLIYHHRIWCMFCPIGTMASWLGKGKYQLAVASNCNDCQRCHRVCRMQINPGSYRGSGVVTHGDCLKCSYCVEECPRGALSFTTGRHEVSKGLTLEG